MKVNKEAMAMLVQEHRAIRASLKWLETSVGDMVPQPDEPECSPQRSELLRNKIRNLSLLLKDLHDGIKAHLERDQQVLKPIAHVISLEEVDKDHIRIEQELTYAITQTERSINEKWTEEQFIRYLSKVKRAVRRISILVEKHTRREDAAIEKELNKMP